MKIISLENMFKDKNNLGKRLARSVTGSFGLVIASTGISYISAVSLARFLGASDYGVYVYALAWVRFLEIPSRLGLEGLLVREISSYQAKNLYEYSHGILKWANKTVLLISVILAISIGIAILFFGKQQINLELDDRVFDVLLIALFLLPINSLSAIRVAALRGFHRVIIAQIPETLILPILFLSFIWCSVFLLGNQLSPHFSMILYVTAASISFVCGSYFLNRSIPPTVKNSTAFYQRDIWLKAALPMLAFSGFGAINSQVDTLMLGYLSDIGEVGLYTVANKGAMLVMFILSAVNISIAPLISSLYTKGDIEKLQKLITMSSRLIAAVSLPIASFFIFGGKWFLMIFGNEFIAASTILSILSISQMVNSLTGSVGQLLTMTGYERDAVKILCVSGLTNISLNLILIPTMNGEGAALATATSTILWNLLMAIQVYRRVGIHSTAFGKIF